MNVELKKKEKRSVYRQVFYGFLVYLTSIAPSMSLGFSAVALPAIESYPNRLNIEEISWIASIASLATPIGCFISGPISDRFGRRPALLCINIVTFVGWIIIGIAFNLGRFQYASLLVGRLFTGLSTGLASMPSTVYMAEISSPRLRGMFTTASAAFFSLGILIVYILGYLFKDNWGTIAFITIVFPCISLFTIMAFIPESPTWLVSKNRINKASKNLLHIYGYKESNQETLNDIQTLIQNRNLSKINSSHRKNAYASFIKKVRYLMRPTCLKPFAIVLTYFFFQQFSGCFVVVFYAIDIVKESDIKMDPYLAICAIALMRLIGAIVTSFIATYIGRRVLSILSGVGLVLSSLLLTVYLYYSFNQNWIPVFSLALYFFSGSIGFVTIPFAMAAECFPTRIRGTATGLLTCFNYIFNFIVVKIFPTMMINLNATGIFLFFGLMSLAGTVFIIAFLPETKGKTLAEIEEYFGKRKKDDRNIQNPEVLDVRS